MRKVISLLFIIILVVSLNTFAKDAFSFEPAEYEDSIIPDGYEGMEPFITGYRDALEGDFSIVSDAKSVHGTNAIQMTMTHAGTKWNIMCKNAVIGGQPENRDTSFLINLTNRDTLWYWLYIPWSAHIDSIFIFVRNQDWEHDGHTVYHASDLRLGRWNELKDGLSDDLSITDGIIQSDFEIHTNPAVNPPACTLYVDAISSKGRVPISYIDTAGQSGIEMPEEGSGAVKVAKSSINCIKYELNVSTLVMVQVFDLKGAKKAEIPIGSQPAGTYSIPAPEDLAAGVYFIVVTAGEYISTGKMIAVQ